MTFVNGIDSDDELPDLVIKYNDDANEISDKEEGEEPSGVLDYDDESTSINSITYPLEDVD